MMVLFPKIPRTHFLILILVGVLFLFIIIASQVLTSHVSGSTVQDILVKEEHLRGPAWVPLGGNQTQISIQLDKEEAGNYGISVYVGDAASSSPSGLVNDSRDVGLVGDDGKVDSLDFRLAIKHPPSSQPSSSVEADFRSCDLYHGKWIYDLGARLYTNNSCPVLTQSQNCQGNGRPDKDYENWRWKPHQCELPRFDARKFLELMRGKTLAFVGDSIARNQMESLLCILWQVEAPKNTGSRRMQRWIFRSTSTTIIRVWSSWLVHKTTSPLQHAPEGPVKVHLDTPDEAFMDLLPRFDITVLSSGHWFDKKTFYVLNGTIVNGGRTKFSNVDAFSISVETALTAIATHPNYTGLCVLRTYTPDHYAGGVWNTGGSCDGNTRPSDEPIKNGYADMMQERQVKAIELAAKKARNGSRFRLMDIKEVSGYRHDGHPGPYRSPNRPKGKKAQDCLHWCMPGPVDTWNEILFELIRREVA